MKIIITESQLKNIVKEQSQKFPILNNTNQTAIGKEKTIADKVTYWLSFLANNEFSMEQKESKKSEVLSLFSPSKIVISDDAQEKAGLPKHFSGLADEWFYHMLFTCENNPTPIKYMVGVKYFSLDDNGKITNMVIG